MTIYFLLSLVTFLAGFTQGLSGFGSILLALPLLAIFMDIRTVIPLLALHAVAMTVILLIQLRQHLAWNRIMPLLLGSIPGIPLGVFFLKTLDTRIIQFIMGMILVVYPLISLRTHVTRSMKPGWAYVFGFLAGCLGGTLSASGPPVIVYTSLQPWSKDMIKVTLQGFYVVSGILVVLMQTLNGLTTVEVWRLFFISLPALLIGTFTGSFFYGRISDQTYRKIMMTMLGLLGIFTIYSALKT
jgi:uncharacterized membrane protein YfcA